MSLDLILSSLGWALLHSVWQGFLAAGIVYTLRVYIKSTGASLRYSFQFLCLIACFVAFVVTFGIYAASGLSGITTTSVTTSFTEIIQLGKLTLAPATETTSTVSYTEILQKSSPLIGAIWIIGFIIVSLRCAISFQMTQALRKSGLSAVPQAWEHRFRTLVLNAGLPRMAKIFISDRVSGPITLGFFKPIVLVPASFFTQLPTDQIEAVLLHEIAHIRRHDYLLNILQTAIKAVFFYHPGIHYISRRINEDREYACDDFSVNETQNPKALAKALAALRLQHPENSFAMAANGKSSPLLARLQRLVKAGPQRRERGQASVPAIALLLSTAIYFSVAPMSEAHPAPEDKKTYEHAQHKLGNYSFDVIDLDGRPVTVKITEDGRRWILVEGAWYDVDKKKNRDTIEDKSGYFTYPVVPPAPPVPPTPPVIAGLDNAGSKASEKAMRKFKKQMDQFEIDMDYFEKSMENWSRDYGRNFSQNFGEEFAENFSTELAKSFSENFDDAWSDEFSAGFEKNFEFQGEDTEHFDDHPGSEHESAAERAAEKRARMIERAEEKREKILARAEEQREDARERMEEAREEAMERAEEQRERAIERAEEQHEEAMERAEERRERAEEQRERAMERMERERERAERALERAERDAERAKRKTKHEAKYNELRSTLYSHLLADNLITSTDEPVTVRYKNKTWTANGTPVPSASENKYCKLFSEHKIFKNDKTVLKFKPKSMHISSQSKDSQSQHRVTVGTFEHDKDKHKGQHKNKNGEWHDDHAAMTPSPSFAFVTPVNGAKIHMRFNEKVHSSKHQGVDLGIRKGTPVYASASGEVDHISTSPSWGKRILIEHKDGFHTVYANLDSFDVKEGQQVKAGDLIGKVGNTADVTVKPHLHFEIRHDGKLIDPEQLIPAF